MATAPVISFGNVKGGTGKTTLVNAVAHEAASQGKRVLVIDVDPQGNISSYLTGREWPATWFDRTIADVLDTSVKPKDRLGIDDVIFPTRREGIMVAPAGSPDAMEAANNALVTAVGKEFVLARALEKAADDFDLILIDCPPALNNLTICAYVASTGGVVIVTAPAQGEIQGMVKLVSTVNEINDALDGMLDAPIEFTGAVVNRYDRRVGSETTNLETLTALSNDAGIPILGLPIPKWAFIADATVVGYGMDEVADSRVPFLRTQLATILDAVEGGNNG